MKPDVYYGAVAENYDASRSGKTKWRNEYAIVKLFLTAGPVLDVPFGTGRFVLLYQEKNFRFVGVDKSADMLAIAQSKIQNVRMSKVIQQDVFEINFAPKSFGTVVCIRFLEWFPLEQAMQVLAKLRPLASQFIVSANHGIEGHPDAYTYDLDKFFEALIVGGFWVEDRRVTAFANGITSEIFKLRLREK